MTRPMPRDMPRDPASRLAEQVLVGDVARVAIDRLEAELAAANAKLDQVREVAAHCEQKSPLDEDGTFDAGYYEAMYECPAYRDAASRLRAIVGGEGS